MARISVVIPTFDGAATLPGTLRSLRRQTRRPDEVIVVDDGTKAPRSRALLARLPRWVTLISKENEGPGLARNLGIARSSGELVLPLDDDDLLRPDALALLEQALSAAPQASFAYGHVRYFGVQRGTAVVPRFNGYLQLFENRLLHCALFRRAVFSDLGVRYPEGPWGLEDWGLWLDCAGRGLQAAVVEAPIFHYRRKGGVGLLHGTQRDRPALVAKLRAQYPALFTEAGLAKLKARDAPALEVLCTRSGEDAQAAAEALAAAQGLPDVRSGRAPATARALLLEARGKYLCCAPPPLARSLAGRGPVLARALAALEQRPEAAWAALEEGAVVLRTERLGGLLEDDVAEGAPPEALARAAQRLLPGLALEAGERTPLPAASGKLSAAARARAASAARRLWKSARGTAERVLGEERVGRALHPLKLRADELAPSLRGAARALRERRLPTGLARGLRRLVPPSVREERAMLDRLEPGADGLRP
jgi:hypothetical protein